MTDSRCTLARGCRVVSVLALSGLFEAGCSDSDAATAAVEGYTLAEADCTECGPTPEHFFEQDHVATLRITVGAEDLAAEGYAPDEELDLLWERWNSHCGPYTFTDVTLEYEAADGEGDAVLEHVGMRMRGGKSRGKNPFAGFKLDFDGLLAEGQSRTFADLNRIEVLSNEGDESNMVQCLSYKMTRDLGLEAPNCNHIKIYLNGKYYGLAQSVERAKDARYLRRHFGTTQGLLLGGSLSCGYADSLADLEYKGEDFESDDYTAAYEILREDVARAEAVFVPMLKCGDDVETPNDEDFKSCIADWIDVDNWLRLIAAESLMPSIESFVGTRRNYFMYFLPDVDAPHQGRMKIWGWDYDTGFHNTTCYPTTCDPFTSVAGWYGPRGQRAKLVTRLTTVFRAEYCDVLNEFLDDIYDPRQVSDMADNIADAMSDDPTFTQDEWQTEVQRLTDYVTDNRETLRALVQTGCETPTE